MERRLYWTTTRTAIGPYVRAEKEKGRKRPPPKEKEKDQLEKEKEKKAPSLFGFKSEGDLKKYVKQVKESEGFDVDYYPCTNHIMRPKQLNDDTYFHTIIRLVMKRYSKKNKALKINVKRLEKCIMWALPWPRFYMTFKGVNVLKKEARKEAKNEVKTYQAIVICVPGLEERYVLRMLRLKPSPFAPREEKHPYDRCCGACSDSKNNDKFDRDWAHGVEVYPGEYTAENLDHYYEQLDASEGFDIDPFPSMHTVQCITPMQPPWREEFVKAVDKLVKEFFRKDKGVELCDSNVLKVNYFTSHCCSHFYITFDAKEGGNGEMNTYQARIAVVPGEPKVEELRLKPCKI